MDAKTCTGCGKTKPYAAYHKDNRAPDGYKNICKVCRMNEGKADKKRQSSGTPHVPSATTPAGLFDAMLGAQDGAPDARQDASDAGDELVVELPEADGTAGAKSDGGLFAGLMDAIKGTTPSGGPKQPKSVRDEQEAMSAQIATGAGWALSVGATLAIPNPYKPCAPTAKHGYAITKPLAEILAEKMDVAEHLSPTMVRLTESAMALLMYGDYAIRMYLTIRQQEALQHGIPATSSAARPAAYGPATPGPAGQQPGAAAADGNTGTSAYSPELFTIQTGEPQGVSASAPARNRARAHRQVGAGAGAVGASGGNDKASQAAAIDALLAADADGRRRLGLVG